MEGFVWQALKSELGLVSGKRFGRVLFSGLWDAMMLAYVQLFFCGPRCLGACLFSDHPSKLQLVSAFTLLFLPLRWLQPKLKTSFACILSETK